MISDVNQDEARLSANIFRREERERSVRNKTSGSLARYERSCASLAGGVSSGLRRSARPYPLFFTHGSGSRIFDVDGNAYLDYTLAWGPLILGHAPTTVSEAVAEQARRGFTFGAQHDLEYEVAEELTRIIPCADLVCFATSGTEIVQLALRLARAVTGRPKFLKFEGHYHGWADSVLCSYHPTPEQLAVAGSSPVQVGAGQRAQTDVVIAQWNDRACVEKIFAEQGAHISAIICEPMLCNSGCIPPEPGFLEFLRELCTKAGALLIFDEVITGFRLGLRGAQGLYGVTPDLAVYAKAVAAGVALSVLAGRKTHMDLIASGKVVHAGTMNGNPLALAACKASLRELAANDGALYQELERRSERLRNQIQQILRNHVGDVTTQGRGAVFQVSFMARPARNYRDLLSANQQMYADFAMSLLDEGIMVLPDGRWYVSAAHTDDDIEATLAAVSRAVFA